MNSNDDTQPPPSYNNIANNITQADKVPYQQQNTSVPSYPQQNISTTAYPQQVYTQYPQQVGNQQYPPNINPNQTILVAPSAQFITHRRARQRQALITVIIVVVVIVITNTIIFAV